MTTCAIISIFAVFYLGMAKYGITSKKIGTTNSSLFLAMQQVSCSHKKHARKPYYKKCVLVFNNYLFIYSCNVLTGSEVDYCMRGVTKD